MKTELTRSTEYAFKFVYSSGDGDEHKHNSLFIALFGWMLYVQLPRIIKPEKRLVKGAFGGYTDYNERRYGTYCFDGHFNVMWGRSNFPDQFSGKREQRWSCFLPWTQWRYIGIRFYDREGDLTEYVPENKKHGFDMQQAAEKRTPKEVFWFYDYDGAYLMATTHMQEREWHFGEGYFKWLSWFRKPLKRRVLGIDFSGETGKRKGSWKGGTTGASIDMLPGELHESAFKRYCEKHDMVLHKAEIVDPVFDCYTPLWPH